MYLFKWFLPVWHGLRGRGEGVGTLWALLIPVHIRPRRLSCWGSSCRGRKEWRAGKDRRSLAGTANKKISCVCPINFCLRGCSIGQDTEMITDCKGKRQRPIIKAYRLQNYQNGPLNNQLTDGRKWGGVFEVLVKLLMCGHCTLYTPQSDNVST
jgi:hypothetical protein